MATMKVSIISVIIPTLNGSKTIGRLLERLSIQTTPPGEIIVVDSGSEDNTVEIVRNSGIEPIVIRREEFNHGGTRNMAAGLAKGDILVFMTQDAIPADENLLKNLILPIKENFNDNLSGIRVEEGGRELQGHVHCEMEPHGQSTVGREPQESPPSPGGRGSGGGGIIAASYARHLPRQDASPIERFTRQYNYPEYGIIKCKDDEPGLGIKTYFFSNACSAVRRDAFKEVGGFPENVPMNEDMLLSYKLINTGYKVAYVPEAMVYHSHNYSPLMQFKKYIAIGASISISGLHREVNSHGEGFRFFKEGLMTLYSRQDLHYIPLFFADSLSRFLGFRLGLRKGKVM